MEENGRPKRNRKPNPVYNIEPDEPKKSRKPRKSQQPEKNRNQALDASKHNKWKVYEERVKRLLAILLREMQTLEVNFEGKSAPERGKNITYEKERLKCEQKIFQAKQAIVSTLRAIASENSEDHKWPQLDQPDEDDMIDVDEILCSRCLKEEENDNDILFCDRAGCLRAYHQKCLDPPLDVANLDPDQDWFCWQCECLDDCLDLISERLEKEYWNWDEVFPEVNQSLEEALKNQNGDTINSALLPDDEEDEDYNPEDEENEEALNESRDEIQDINSSAVIQGKDVEATGNEEVEEEMAEDEDDEDDKEEDSDFEDDENDEEEEDMIDEDEVNELLNDAQNDLVYEPIALNEPTTTRKLRERKPKKEGPVIKVEGANDVGKPIAKIRRGVFALGKVIEFIPCEADSEDISKGSWKVRFASSKKHESNNGSETKEESSLDIENPTEVVDESEDEEEQEEEERKVYKEKLDFIFNEDELR